MFCWLLRRIRRWKTIVFEKAISLVSALPDRYPAPFSQGTTLLDCSLWCPEILSLEGTSRPQANLEMKMKLEALALEGRHGKQSPWFKNGLQKGMLADWAKKRVRFVKKPGCMCVWWRGERSRERLVLIWTSKNPQEESNSDSCYWKQILGMNLIEQYYNWCS